MKGFMRIIEQEIIKVIDTSEMQFGFIPGRETIDTIFIAQQLKENYIGKKNPSLCYCRSGKSFQQTSLGVDYEEAKCR